MGNTDKFDMMADKYDTTERTHIAKVSSDAIRGCLADSKNKSAIDFGCGTGLVGLSLLDEFESMLLMDTSQNMLDQVELKIKRRHIQNAKTMCFDLEKDTLPNLDVDYIFMAQVLLHIKDYAPVLHKLFDMLNVHGHLIIVDFDRNENVVSDLVHSGFDRQELTDMMRNIGFESIQTETFYSGSKIFMGCDASMFILDAQK